MRVEDYYPQGKRWWVRLHEKGGKRHEIPAYHTLEAYLDAYSEVAGVRESGKSPLFRSAVGRTGMLMENAMNRIDAYRMIRRRRTFIANRATRTATGKWHRDWHTEYPPFWSRLYHFAGRNKSLSRY